MSEKGRLSMGEVGLKKLFSDEKASSGGSKRNVRVEGEILGLAKAGFMGLSAVKSYAAIIAGLLEKNPGISGDISRELAASLSADLDDLMKAFKAIAAENNHS